MYWRTHQPAIMTGQIRKLESLYLSLKAHEIVYRERQSFDDEKIAELPK